MDAKHQADRRSRSRVAIIVLVAGAVVALALCLGGVWLVRTGVVVAASTGAAALVLMVRQLGQVEAEASLAEARAVQDAAREERRHHAESMGIIERFSGRVADLRGQIDALQAEAEGLRRQLADRDRLVASMRSTQESLLANAVDMRQRIVVLEQQIAVREAELRAAQDAAAPQQVAEILPLPTRRQLAARPSDDEVVIWDEAVGH